MIGHESIKLATQKGDFAFRACRFWRPAAAGLVLTGFFA
jgi:hypothetical protein